MHNLQTRPPAAASRPTLKEGCRIKHHIKVGIKAERGQSASVTKKTPSYLAFEPRPVHRGFYWSSLVRGPPDLCLWYFSLFITSYITNFSLKYTRWLLVTGFRPSQGLQVSQWPVYLKRLLYTGLSFFLLRLICFVGKKLLHIHQIFPLNQ
jgi:hypothetical protein